MTKGGGDSLKALGIIAEYNPFHLGHQYHLKEARSKTGTAPVIGVISGNFTQRGMPALFDKWTRAHWAVQSGIDLIIELPAAFSIRSAQDFAAGGVRLCASLGLVSHLCFGAEDADIALLTDLARKAGAASTATLLRQQLKLGKPYAAALSAALQSLSNASEALLIKPNNILAIEYLKALAKLEHSIIPIAIQRQTAQHHDAALTASISSAAAIRAELKKTAPDHAALRAALPPAVHQAICCGAAISERSFPDIAWLDSAILTTLRLKKPCELAQIATLSEGLENRLAAAALTSTNSGELLAAVKSKRYPMSRLQRTLLHCLLGSTKPQFAAFDATGPLYARVLAFNPQERALLKELKTTSKIPIITKTTDYLTTHQRGLKNLSPLQQMLAFDTYATDLYTLCRAVKGPGALDFTKSPAYVK